MRHKRIFISTGVLLIILMLSSFAPANSRDNFTGPNQSWPTRTNTPGPTSTRIPGGPTAPPSGETPAPPSTPSEESPTPSVTSTLIPPGTVVSDQQATPIGTSSLTPDLFSDIDECAIPPIAQVLDTVNIRSGPGLTFILIGTLRFGEQRPIIGRSAFEPWWLLQLDSYTEGWVLDSAVSITGHIGFVPVLELPSPDGGTLTPGPRWQPTPNPNCQTTISTDLSPTTPSITGASVDIQPETGPTAGVVATATVDNVDQPGLVSMPEGIGTSPQSRASGGNGLNLLLILGIILMLAGIMLYLFQRRRNGHS